MAPCKDRSGGIGFRCVVDAPEHRRAGITLALRGAPCELDGLLGEALAANHRGRLSTSSSMKTSPADRAVRSRACATQNHEGDWYGEHAGKWLLRGVARGRIAHGDAALARERAARRRLSGRACRPTDGYLGTYAPERRFTAQAAAEAADLGRRAERAHVGHLDAQLCDPRPARGAPIFPESRAICGGAPHRRSLLARADRRRHRYHRARQPSRHVGDRAARSGGRAVLRDWRAGAISISRRCIVEQADRDPALALLRQLLAGADASEIAHRQGLSAAVESRRSGEAASRDRTSRISARPCTERVASIRDAPSDAWAAGRGAASRTARAKCSTHANAFSPHAYVETCSTLAWIQLNRELLAITGDARYAAEIERSAYNDLLGAQAPNGEDWCYYSFPNGRRVHTTYWRCCKSSGAMALEELPSIAYGLSLGRGYSGQSVFGPAASLDLPGTRHGARRSSGRAIRSRAR